MFTVAIFVIVEGTSYYVPSFYSRTCKRLHASLKQLPLDRKVYTDFVLTPSPLCTLTELLLLARNIQTYVQTLRKLKRPAFLKANVVCSPNDQLTFVFTNSIYFIYPTKCEHPTQVSS